MKIGTKLSVNNFILIHRLVLRGNLLALPAKIERVVSQSLSAMREKLLSILLRLAVDKDGSSELFVLHHQKKFVANVARILLQNSGQSSKDDLANVTSVISSLEVLKDHTGLVKILNPLNPLGLQLLGEKSCQSTGTRSLAVKFLLVNLCNDGRLSLLNLLLHNNLGLLGNKNVVLNLGIVLRFLNLRLRNLRLRNGRLLLNIFHLNSLQPFEQKLASTLAKINKDLQLIVGQIGQVGQVGKIDSGHFRKLKVEKF
jgi:hypothetical protein